jgi:MftR C-terminal domain
MSRTSDADESRSLVAALYESAATHYEGWERAISGFAVVRIGQPADSLFALTIGRTSLTAARSAYDAWAARPGADLPDISMPPSPHWLLALPLTRSLRPAKWPNVRRDVVALGRDPAMPSRPHPFGASRSGRRQSTSVRQSSKTDESAHWPDRAMSPPNSMLGCFSETLDEVGRDNDVVMGQFVH